MHVDTLRMWHTPGEGWEALVGNKVIARTDTFRAMLAVAAGYAVEHDLALWLPAGTHGAEQADRELVAQLAEEALRCD